MRTSQIQDRTISVSVDETETYYFSANSEKIHGKQYMHELLMQSASPTTLGQFYLHSHLYNIHGLVDQSGNVIERYRYEAYGKRAVFDPLFAPRTASIFNQHFGQTGHYLDPETGMYYYGYRYYAPELGRWISRDPIEEGDGWNLYAFVRDRPVTLKDMLGLKCGPWSPWITFWTYTHSTPLAGSGYLVYFCHYVEWASRWRLTAGS